jgi:hypothetical protein
MRKTPISLSIVIFYILVFYSFSSAQQDTTMYQIIRLELKDGSILIGKLLSEDDSTIQIKTLSNIEALIQKQQIKRREIVSGQMVEGELWRKDPNRTRLLFAPTGRALKAGQGYFSTYEILFPFLAIGITDFLTVAGGISLVPGAENQLLYIAPKITPVQLDKFDLSAGVLYIRIPEEENAAGIVYGVGTYGTDKSALTLGLGYGFAGGEFADSPIFAIGGELRASKSVKFITENWIFPGEEVQLLSGGLRFFGENLAADFAFIFPAGSDIEGFPFIPWVGFVYNFGAK